jgi:hypothetical protein
MSQPSEPQDLPNEFLSDSSHEGDSVAQVLESLGLAYVEVGIFNNLQPLGGFVNLLDLGRAGDGNGTGLNSYDSASDFLTQWVSTGKFATSVQATHRVLPTPNFVVDGIDENSSANERRDALVKQLGFFKNFYAEGYGKHLDALGSSVNVLSSPPLWISMYHMIDTSLDQLIAAVQNIPINGVTQNAGSTNAGGIRF